MDNRYQILKKIGSGASGSVYLALDHRLGKKVAVKKTGKLTDNETDVVKSLESHSFPHITDVITCDIYSYLVMDLLTGSPLSKVCKNNPPTKEQMINWGIDVATAIKGLHSLSPSMLYMDCKPDNLILCEDGSVRPVDIGSIYICDSSDRRRISGTAAFAAPEQKSCGQIDIRTDIYGLGMTLYYLAAGAKKEYRNPKGELDILKINPSLGRPLADVIAKATSLKPSGRFPNMDEMIKALEGARISSLRLCLATLIKRSFRLLYKASFALFSLLSFLTFKEGSDLLFLILGILLMSGIIAGSADSERVLEIHEDIFLGSGKKILSAVLLLILLTAKGDRSLAAEYPSTDQATTSYVLYDSQGDKCLYYGTHAVSNDRDLTIKIPVSSLTQGSYPSVITVAP